MKTIKDIPKANGKRALVRVDFNVPMKGATIVDTRRIDASFSTIRALQKKGMQVLLLAHRGEAKDSLRPVATYLSKHFKTVFITESLEHTEKVQALCSKVSTDTVVLFENIRRYEGEEKNDGVFVKTLARLGDIFINDAFSVSHRSHASVVGLAKVLPSYGGIQLEAEVKALSETLKTQAHPFLFLLGGAKFSTKIPLLKRFIKDTDHVVITGAILNSFYKTAGFEVGDSVVEDGYEKEIKTLLRSPKLLLPIDVVVLRKKKSVVCTLDEITRGDVIVDIGPQSAALIGAKIAKAKLVVWNGPTGWYEKGFTKGTIALAESLIASKAKAVVGGGDTGALVQTMLGVQKKIFVSTGGGATLEYLAKGTLPGIKALQKK